MRSATAASAKEWMRREPRRPPELQPPPRGGAPKHPIEKVGAELRSMMPRSSPPAAGASRTSPAGSRGRSRGGPGGGLGHGRPFRSRSGFHAARRPAAVRRRSGGTRRRSLANSQAGRADEARRSPPRPGSRPGFVRRTDGGATMASGPMAAVGAAGVGWAAARGCPVEEAGAVSAARRTRRQTVGRRFGARRRSRTPLIEEELGRLGSDWRRRAPLRQHGPTVAAGGGDQGRRRRGW